MAERRPVAPLGGALILVAAWYLLAAALRTPALPWPHAVAARLPALIREGLAIHTAASPARAVAALAFSFAVALPAGVALGRIPALDRFLAPVVYLLSPVPKIALLPVVLLLVGINDVARILVVVLDFVFQMLVAVTDAVRSVEPQYLLSARSLGAAALAVFRFVLWPSLLPRLLSAVRVGTGTALAVLFFAGTFGTRWGLGYLVTERWMRVAHADMYAAIACLGLVGLATSALADLAERRLCRWTRAADYSSARA